MFLPLVLYSSSRSATFSAWSATSPITVSPIATHPAAASRSLENSECSLLNSSVSSSVFSSGFWLLSSGFFPLLPPPRFQHLHRQEQEDGRRGNEEDDIAGINHALAEV